MPTAPRFRERAAVVLALALATAIRADAQEEPVVRVSLELIQVDAVVTDGTGRYVTDLTAADFELREDGKLRAITHCSYLPLAPASPSPAARPVAPGRSPEMNREDARRTMAFVVDDLSLSFESMVRVRKMLSDFVDREMQPGDVAAIVRVSAGMGVLEQLTADRRLLHTAIDRIRFSLRSRGVLLSTMAAAGGDGPAAGGAGGAALAAAEAQLRSLLSKSERSREVLSAAGTLGALNLVLQGLRGLPGRKSVVLLSEGFSLYDEDGFYSTWLADAVGRASDAANRASVVVYALDPSGLQTLRPTAASTGAAKGSAHDLEKVRAGVRTMAADTGGLFFGDTNDLGDAVGKVLRDQQGYYLIGYEPDEATFRAPRGPSSYHRIALRVKRPGLRVRSRKGFYAVPDPLERPAPEDPIAQVLAAVASPFARTDVRVRLTSLYAYEKERGGYLRSLLHLDARDLTFTPGTDGSHRAELQIATLSFGADGRVLEQLVRSDGIRVVPGGMDVARRDGLVYVLDLPVKRAGAFQVRVAVRDAASGRLGRAGQLVEVPDVRKGRFALSGVVMGGTGDDPQASPAVRRFRPGAHVPYSFFVYNARRAAGTAQPRLEVRTSLVHDGNAVLSPPATRVESAASNDGLALGGTLVLPAALESGPYLLEISVLDLLAKGDHRLAAGSVEFDVSQGSEDE
jgi:VWFA-related protein